jgi:hypothetical protein
MLRPAGAVPMSEGPPPQTGREPTGAAYRESSAQVRLAQTVEAELVEVVIDRTSALAVAASSMGWRSCHRHSASHE